MAKKTIEIVIKYRWIAIILMILISGFFVAQISRMEMFTQFLDLFPHDHPYVKVHKQYATNFGGAYQATLMLEVREGGKYKDVFNIETLSKISRIQYDVDLIDGVDHFGIFSIASRQATYTEETAYGFSTKIFMKDVPKNKQEVENLRKTLLTSPSGGTLVSGDQKALLLNANFLEGRIDFNKLFDGFMKIKKREEDENHKIYLTGMPLVYGWIYHYVPHMTVIFIITALMIIGLSLVYLKGILVIFPILGALLCSIWGLGLSAMLGFHFDPLIVVIPFLLSARAMSHGVQMVERFSEEYTRLEDSEKAALVTGTGLLPPGLISILTDAVGLFVISLAPIPIIKNLAYLGTFWAVSAVFVVLLFFPVLFSMLKNIKLPKSGEGLVDSLLQRFLAKMATWTFGKGRYVTVSLACLVLIVAVISSKNLKYGDANPGTPILWPASQYNQDIENINGRFPGVDQMWIVFEGYRTGAVAFPDFIQGMESMKRSMLEDPNVGFATSVADFVKEINMLARGNDPKMSFLPDDEQSISELIHFMMMGSTTSMLDPWLDSTWTSANVRLYLKSHEGSVLKEVTNRVERWINEHADAIKNGKPKPAGGLGGILAAANEVIEVKNDQILFAVLGVVFILCAVTYRSLVAGVLFTMSLVLANFLAFTYMVSRGVGLNINTLPVAALGIGLGVDYGLYIVSRIKESYDEESGLRFAVVRGVTTAGKAVFFTATMMTVGVVFWYFSPLRFQAEMGFLLAILMMVNMFVGLMVLPAVINILKPKFICKNSKTSG